MNSLKPDFSKGLLPAIVQDHLTAQVLMLGYMSPEAWQKTQRTGLVTFYSRSRECLWTKGETSGHTLELKKMFLDCDSDTVLVLAKANGPTCHLNKPSCFDAFEQAPQGMLANLEQIIEQRSITDPEHSYTASLLAKPTRKIAQKVGEEGVEVALAAVDEDDNALLGESADLIFHLMVTLKKRNLKLAQVLEVLDQRHQKATSVD